MRAEVAKYLETLKEVKHDLLESFSSRDEAIAHLVEETNLSEEECSNAYDLLVKIDFSKNLTD